MISRHQQSSIPFKNNSFEDDFRSLEMALNWPHSSSGKRPWYCICVSPKTRRITMPDLLTVTLVNIFSVGAIREWGMHFDGPNNRLINETGEGVAEFECHRNVPFLKLHEKHLEISARAIDFWTLHARFGHANLDATIQAGKQADYRVLSEPKDLSGCSTCHTGKNHQQQSGFNRPKIKNALELLDVDIIHHTPLGFGGMTVFIQVRCRGSGFSWGKACKLTIDAATWLANHLLLLRRQMGN